MKILKNERKREKSLAPNEAMSNVEVCGGRLKICNKILFSALVKLGQGVCLQMGKVCDAASASSCSTASVVLFCGRQINFFSLSRNCCFCFSSALSLSLALALRFNVLSLSDLGTVDYRSYS